MTKDAIISIHDLHYSYDTGGAPALDSLSLEIPAASVTAVLGPNGSGKTTLLLILLGLLPVQKGTILFDGKPRTNSHNGALTGLIGLVPQREFVPFEFSVLEYVLLGRAPHLGFLQTPSEQDYAIARHSIEQAGIEALEDRPVSSLSGGEHQLAMIARALAQKAKILLLDEPTSHLDLANTARILQMVKTLARENVAVILTTHDPNTAAAVADYAILLRRGVSIAAASVPNALTSANLSMTYNIPVEVVQVRGRSVILTTSP